MAMDPQAGKKMPEQDQPEAMPEQPKEMPAGGSDQDARAQELMQRIDEEMNRRGMAPEEGEAADKEEAADEGGEDLKPLEETLGITAERAKMLFDAAQQLAKTEGKSPKELADMIASDFDVLMQLEMIAARGDEAKPEEAMPAPEAAAPGMPPAMPPAMEPQGGM